jgi:hypothetical protein
MPVRSRSFALRLVACSVLLGACRTSAPGIQAPQSVPSNRPQGAGISAPWDSAAAERDSLTRIVRQQIAGRESEPASKVFENVEVLTENVSAANLVQAMNFYGSALGVSCSHCHEIGKWASDEKPKKEVARAMMRMNGVINGQLLKGITGLRSASPSVNCVTCHRGQLVPARSLSGNR